MIQTVKRWYRRWRFRQPLRRTYRETYELNCQQVQRLRLEMVMYDELRQRANDVAAQETYSLRISTKRLALGALDDAYKAQDKHMIPIVLQTWREYEPALGTPCN